MNYDQFVNLVDRMLTEQQRFFKSDKNSAARKDALEKSKQLEGEVRKAINEHKKNQTKLF